MEELCRKLVEIMEIDLLNVDDGVVLCKVKKRGS